MNKPDHATCREWLYLDADGELAPERASLLEAHLASCPECRKERDELGKVDALLHAGRLAVRPGFRKSVMAALPAAGWEARAPRSWSLPTAAFALLAVAGAVLVGLSSGAQDSSGLGAVLAMLGLLKASLLAGAGLLGASWKGLGLAFDEILASKLALGACAALVLCLNLLLVSLVRHRRAATALVETPEATEVVVRQGDDGSLR